MVHLVDLWKGRQGDIPALFRDEEKVFWIRTATWTELQQRVEEGKSEIVRIMCDMRKEHYHPWLEQQLLLQLWNSQERGIRHHTHSAPTLELIVFNMALKQAQAGKRKRGHDKPEGEASSQVVLSLQVAWHSHKSCRFGHWVAVKEGHHLAIELVMPSADTANALVQDWQPRLQRAAAASAAWAANIAVATAAATATITEWRPAEVSPEFDLLVANMGGEVATLCVSGFMLVSYVKELVEAALGVQSDMQRLYGKRGELMNKKMLWECGVGRGAEGELEAATLQLTVQKSGE